MTSRSPTVSETLEARLDAPSLVFVGIAIHWKPRPADLTTHTLLAEQWRDRFSSWQIADRTVSLQDLRNRYSVSLSDGKAQFLVETPHGLDRALEQVPQFLDQLPPESRERRGRIETQYLRSSELAFENRLEEVAPRLIRETFPTSVSMKLKDFAYMSDFELEGDVFQLSIGVVRKDEIPRRVYARVPNAPAVATFCNIAQTWGSIEKANDCMAALDRTLSVGRLIMNELR